MKRTVSCLLGLLLFVLGLYAQEAPFLTERVYVAPLQAQIAPGDTLRVAGQALASDRADFYPYSRYVWVELLGAEGEELSRTKARLDDRGFFSVAMPTERSWTTGEYHLRGYTQFMLNDPAHCFPETSVWLGATGGGKEPKVLTARFFPEGGSLVAGVPQRVAVWLSDGAGPEFPIRFAVCTASGDTLQEGVTGASGYGSFVYTPEAGASTAVLRVAGADGSSLLFPLPAANGLAALQATLHKGRLVCRVCDAAGHPTSAMCLFASHSCSAVANCR